MTSNDTPANSPAAPKGITLASEEEHLAGANYIVWCAGRKAQAAETKDEVDRLLGGHPFGIPHGVTSPAGLSVREWIPY